MRVELWRSGVDLSFAWLHYGSDRQRRQQVERRGTPASLVIQELMMGDIFGMLASNKLRAMGFRIAPDLSDGPIPIPNDVFEADQRPHWQSEKVSASGYVYERVRVLPPDSPEPEIANAATPEAQTAIEATVAPKDRSMYGLCARVFDALKADNESSVWVSAELLEESFREKYAEVHRGVAKLKPPPQLRTLRTHLKKYREGLRQVSANVGDFPDNAK